MSLSATAPPEPSTQVVWLAWDDYLGWLAGEIRRADNAWGESFKLGAPWQPGQHMALIGTTGDGKTTHAVGILGLRDYVLALDPKGEDETLAQSGYVRVRDLPREGLSSWRGRDQSEWRKIHKRIDDGRGARVIVGGGARTDSEDDKLQKLMREAISYCRHAGGWTLYVDEFELLSSQRMFHLGPLIERMLITARRDRTSVVTSFQAPAWVSKHATRQAKWTVCWPIGDPDMIKTVAQGMGRNWKEVGQVIDELPQYHTATIPRGKRGGPIVLTCAPRLSAKRSARGTSSAR